MLAKDFLSSVSKELNLSVINAVTSLVRNTYKSNKKPTSSRYSLIKGGTIVPKGIQVCRIMGRPNKRNKGLGSRSTEGEGNAGPKRLWLHIMYLLEFPRQSFNGRTLGLLAGLV